MKKATMETSMGTITLELDEQKAPLTVANFAEYAAAGHYDGTIFHRVIDGFMIQGGGFTKEMNQKPTRAPIRNEAANGLGNRRGTIAMARLGYQPVLHQPRRQRLPRLPEPHPAGLRLRRLRRGD